MRNSVLYILLLLCYISLYGFDGTHPANPLPEESRPDSGQNFDVRFYKLDLNVSDTSTYIRGNVSVYVSLTDQSSNQLQLDMADFLMADSVKVNDTLAEFSHTDNVLHVIMPVVAMPGAIVKTQVYYHGLGMNAGNVSGIYNKVNSTWNKRITWTLSEPLSALSWFPCKQSLTDKADSVYVFLSTDPNLKAGSNGILTASVSLPGNRIRYEWKCRYPIDYYLISFSVSDYMDYSFYIRNKDATDSILIQNYIYNDSTYFEQNKASIDKTADFFNLYSGLFGEYPFTREKYGHCVAPAGGGMENQTMTTLVNFSFLLVAHELSHQWFGDYVTCKTWQDIWINEGFASYAEYLAYQYLVSQSDADDWMSRTHDYVKTQSGGSVYVPDGSMHDEDRIFDSRLSYSKGAAIIHMIRQEVGDDDLFFAILREFLIRYSHGNASGQDFKNLLAEMTGMDFDSFFDQWYYGEGYPTFALNWNHNNDTLYISSLETTSSSTSLFNVLMEFRVTSNGRDTVISHRQMSGYDTWQLYLPGEITQVTPDPRHWLLMNMSGINRIINLEKTSRYTLMPNPARDRITLRFNEPVDNYTIYLADATGKILYTELSKFSRKNIDIENLPRGIYFVIVNEKNIIYPSKFIKN